LKEFKEYKEFKKYKTNVLYGIVFDGIRFDSNKHSSFTLHLSNDNYYRLVLL
jgi:hypothetical protein